MTSVAILLYLLPILAGLRDISDITEEVKDWMREHPNAWYPSLAKSVAIMSLLLWPLICAIDAIIPEQKE